MVYFVRFYLQVNEMRVRGSICRFLFSNANGCCKTLNTTVHSFPCFYSALSSRCIFIFSLSECHVDDVDDGEWNGIWCFCALWLFDRNCVSFPLFFFIITQHFLLMAKTSLGSTFYVVLCFRSRFGTLFNGKIYLRVSRTWTSTPNVAKIKLSPINLRHSFDERLFSRFFVLFFVVFFSVFSVTRFFLSLYFAQCALCVGCIWQQIIAWR